MFQMRDEMYRASPQAERNFRVLRTLNLVSRILLVLACTLAVWNILVAIDSRINPGGDLADTGVSPTAHISGLLLFAVAGITFMVYLYKELRFGELTVGSSLFLGTLVFLALVPVAGDEVQDPLKDQVPSVTYFSCAPGALEGGLIEDRTICEQGELGAADFLLADRNPASVEATFRTPRAVEPGRVNWSVQARTVYQAYFMVKQPSMESCESSEFAVTLDGTNREGGWCMEHDDAAWLVIPLAIAPELPGSIHLFQVMNP